MASTFYGVLGGQLTTSKTCNREAVHKAVEAEGFVWGVCTPEGKLLVINKSEAHARNWEDPWKSSPTYEVVKVYAGKKAAEQAATLSRIEQKHGITAG